MLQKAKELLADPKSKVESLLELIPWLTRDISNLRARKKCAQNQQLIDEITEETTKNEEALDQIKKEIVRRCS